ncbi:MAG: cupin domain-containing protein [Clostridium sp.]|nr:cupin domain-containing protein [Clostridium sp.]
MKIDYNSMAEQPLERFKGGDGVMMSKMICHGMDKIMRNRLPAGASIGLHKHEDSSEAIFMISGHGMAICDGAEERLAPGQCTFCPKGSEHTLINTGDEDLCFYAFVPYLGED